MFSHNGSQEKMDVGLKSSEKSLSRSYKFNSCHWFTHPACCELGSVLPSPPQTCFEMLKPRKMGKELRCLLCKVLPYAY